MSAEISNVESKPAKCKLDGDECISLSDILVSFNSPISEEHAWALCYECAKCFVNAFSRNRDKCRLVKKLDQVLLHKDGYVHVKSILCEEKFQTNAPEKEIVPRGRKSTLNEKKLLAGLGYVIFQALDFSIDEDEERAITPQLEWLLNFMIQKDRIEVERTCPETDDEGIEKDSGECDDDTRKPDDISLNRVLEVCKGHVGAHGTDEADVHYRAVCRALVAEAQELSSFLQKVSEGKNDLYLRTDTVASSEALDNLNFQDWARLWIQVIRELRYGVKLKKVVYSRTPIEYELTPYEILMEDIRSRRYKLNKVMIDGSIPAPIKKDAHAIILEFIRSRPPLKKASERQLPPPRRAASTPRERLLESIKQGNVKLRKCITSTPKRLVPYADNKNPNKNSENNNSFAQRQGSTRRLIKVDYSVIQNTDDDDDDDDDEERHSDVNGDSDDRRANEEYRSDEQKEARPIGSDLSTRVAVQNAMFRTAYDLATQCPSRKSTRRHTMVCILPSGGDDVGLRSRHLPQNGSACLANNAQPQRSWSRSSLQDELFESKQWQDECLSLTLEEIVHIRNVLTKAELESLPVEGRVKEDVEKRKVCFLCLKTRFSLFGPWGQICRLCKRTVCARCSSKMRIPTEHFSHVPVVALSPTMSPVEHENSMANAILSRLNGVDTDRGKGVGSAPTSPKVSRVSTSPAPDCHKGSTSQPQSLVHAASPSHCHQTDAKNMMNENSERKPKNTKVKAEKLKGVEMIICMDCKTMVIQIIKSSRTNKANNLNSLTLDLTSVH